MGKVRRRYEEQYKREAVRFLEETGQPLAAVAKELGVAEGTLWRWRKRYGRGTQEVLSPSEAAELRRLRRENELLRQERDFLKKATAYFAHPSP
ncbi:MAG: transposase [Gemmatimonadota bacterium]|nr:MAG: transposase [Gemmatimonadota bacterium]